MADSIARILAQFKEALRADPKKTAILCVLCLVLMVVLARQIFFGPTVEPTKASTPLAATSPPATAQPGALIRPTVAVIGIAPSNRPAAVSSPQAKLLRPHTSASTSEKVVSVKGLPRTLARNVFDTTSWSRFARSQPAARGNSGEGGEDQPPSWLMRIGRKLASYGRSQREEEQKIDQDLAKLRLESTMTGRVPLAHISGRLVREGDHIAGFSVVHIWDREVMLRKAGVTRVLSMP